LWLGVLVKHARNRFISSAAMCVLPLDLAILGHLLSDGRIPFKELAKATGSDQRTVASRFQRLLKAGVIKSTTIEVDWSKVGLTATAIIGGRTSTGEDSRKKLLEFIRKESRIIEAYTAIGTHEYLMKVVDKDIATLRNEMTMELEPLTSDVGSSVIVETIKTPDFKGLLKYARGKLCAPPEPHTKRLAIV
jgi:Lrp/AsnC family leucine-responsive transcriptional regulator